MNPENKYPYCDDSEKVTDFLLKQKGKVFVDVGAHTGFYSLRLMDSFEDVYAYEPFKDAAKFIEVAKRRLGIPNIEIRVVALGNKVGKTKFYISARGPKCNSTLKVSEDYILVPCSTLNKDFEGVEIDLIKVDVEGGELEVLKGADKIMKNVKSWIVEVHCKNELLGKGRNIESLEHHRFVIEIQTYLASFGYETRWLVKNAFIYARR